MFSIQLVPTLSLPSIQEQRNVVLITALMSERLLTLDDEPRVVAERGTRDV